MDSAVIVRETLIGQIVEAFAQRERPADAKLARRCDRYVDYEGNKVGDFFLARRWQELTLADLRKAFGEDPSSCINFLQTEAFCYYLPALMQLSMNVEECAGIAETVTYILLPPVEGDSDYRHERFEEIRSLLTRREKRSVSDFLDYVACEEERLGDPNNDARLALQRYWDQERG